MILALVKMVVLYERAICSITTKFTKAIFSKPSPIASNRGVLIATKRGLNAAKANKTRAPNRTISCGGSGVSATGEAFLKPFDPFESKFSGRRATPLALCYAGKKLRNRGWHVSGKFVKSLASTSEFPVRLTDKPFHPNMLVIESTKLKRQKTYRSLSSQFHPEPCEQFVRRPKLAFKENH